MAWMGGDSESGSEWNQNQRQEGCGCVEWDESKEQASGSTSMIHPIVHHPATQRGREPGTRD